MTDLVELARQLNPSQTVLLLGAGSSVPSGGPTGKQLASKLAKRLHGFRDDSDSYSLAEVCSVFEARAGRADLAKAIRAEFIQLTPAGGLQLLPSFDWYRIYSTNFDQLVEAVYSDADRQLTVVRSNFDLSRDRMDGSAELFKIHGCMTEDEGFGNKSRMLLTEADYEEPDNFRQIAFRALSGDMLTKDVLVVGQSLADEHLRDLVREALKLHNTAGTPGRVFVLSFEPNETRASLLRDRGAQVYFGDLDHFLDTLLRELPSEEVRSEERTSGFDPSALPSELLGATTSVGHSLQLASNVRKLFNGSAATYADISSRFTFARSIHQDVISSLRERPIAVLLGAGGVGKTTLARQIAVDIGQSVDAAWEHNSAFPFRADRWIEYEGRLRQLEKSAVLIVDDCTDALSQVSALCDHLGRTESPALQLVLTATTGKWKQRSKSRFVFTHGQAFTLSRLSPVDISALVDLTATTPAIRELVEQRFLMLPRGEQLRVLRDRCSADMYVCMKNIFASEEIDFILLREFTELPDEAQDVYRHVSALQALGARVHRQLILRMLGMEVGGLTAILDQLSGVVSEFDINARDGLYGWETRHRVIAEVIAQYKYAQQSELDTLFENLIDSSNPSVRLEVESLRALCAEPFGVDRLSDPSRQVELLARVVRLLPAEPIPRHRLIRHLIDQDRLDDAGRELANARDAIRMNPVLARYEVLLLMRRAELTEGLMDEDRVALLLDAEGKAAKNIVRYSTDMQTFRIYGDVATALARRGAGTEYLQHSLDTFRDAEPTILDPQFAEMRRHVESALRQAQAA